MKRSILLLGLLPCVALAQIDNVSLTGTATLVPSITNPVFQPPVPFEVSFTVDSASGIQSFQSCGALVCAFSAQDLAVSNLQGTINGASQAMGSGAGAFGSGPGSVIFSAFGAGNLTWEFDVPTQGLLPNLNSILNAAPTGDASALNGWILDVQQVAVVDPPASVPTPKTVGLFLLGFLSLIVGPLMFAGRHHD